MDNASRSALALVVASRDVPIPRLPLRSNCVIERAGTIEIALELARDTRPDVILVAPEVAPERTAVLCHALRSDSAIGRNVPILRFTLGPPTAEERVAALHSGVWDVIRLPMTGEEFALTVRVYSQAKWTLQDLGTQEWADIERRLQSADELARQAHRTGALMARTRAGLACVVFEVERDPVSRAAGSLIARMTRMSDIVGVISPRQIGIVAPATGHEGAVQLAVRIAREMQGRDGEPAAVPAARILAGIDAVPNVKYSPVDPVAMMQRAAAAARTGEVEPGYLWLRRHRGEVDRSSEPAATAHKGAEPARIVR